MPLSMNEIRARALAFSKEWENEASEDAEAKTFWDGFFNIFGISRRRVASFEEPIRKTDGKGGYIDLLWRGKLLVEHKSKGKNLDRAFTQAKDYFSGLKDRDLPQYILVSDFARFRLYEIEVSSSKAVAEFPLEELHKNIRHFGFISGYETHPFEKEDPVNVKAAAKLGALHDELKLAGFQGHVLEVFLVRVLFCLFADDTNIFSSSQFREFLEQRTHEDGSDLGGKLNELFQTLNTPIERRLRNLDEQLSAFPYVNGRLFAEVLPTPAFTAAMRESLLESSALDWSRISPAIFGSLFQSIMDKAARRNLGAHYTREENILKAIGPLFLDELREEFDRIRSDVRRLSAFHKKLTSIRILDPACGCGNFLVIAYRELRELELLVLRALQVGRASGALSFELSHIVSVDVDQFFGIEIEEFPAQIAQVAMWLTDHQMNIRVSEEFGEYFVRLPLKKAATVVCADALDIDWRTLVAPQELTYILGNPPFVGKKEQSDLQKAQVLGSFAGIRGAGVLDYVACWYIKSARYIAENPEVQCAFVSTNSISQGEQVGVLWSALSAFEIRINFAHRTFNWTSEARGKAAVHCVIIGFGMKDRTTKRIFDYSSRRGEAEVISAASINPYLVDAPTVFIERRTVPIDSRVPEMAYGSMPIDDGNLVLSAEERAEILVEHPDAAPYLRRYVGGEEFLNSLERYCIWLVGCPPELQRDWRLIQERVERNRVFRESSGRQATKKLARTPGLFGEIRQPTSEYLLVPKVSSEARTFLPIGYVNSDTIASGSTLIVAHATLFHFGVLQSTMHMSWMRTVCGRMKSDYQYSAGIVYNNFPWPTATDSHIAAIELAAKEVLEVRGAFSGATLADLYDPLRSPPQLLKAHDRLDRAVDMAFGRRSFRSEASRVAFLFARFQALAAPIDAAMGRKRRDAKAR